MRFAFAALLVVVAAGGCGPAQKTVVHPSSPPAAAAAAPATDSGSGCNVRSRKISVPGLGGVRPDVATTGLGFAVVWEETGDAHRGIHFQSVDALATPIGPSVEVADLARGGAEPRLVADGDGYAVFWTVDQPDTSMIMLRRVDARGKPLGDAVTVLSTPNARLLGAARVDDGFAVAWWTWSHSPQEQSLSWLDFGGKVRSRVLLTRGALTEPEVDLLPAGPEVAAAWIENADGIDHLFVGELTRAATRRRLDLGPGSMPRLLRRRVVFGHPGDGTVWISPVDAATPSKLADGQSADAVEHRVCLFRTVSSEESSSDELRCLDVDGGRVARDQRIASVPGGVLALRLAESSDGTTGLVYQTEEGDEMTVTFASLQCAR